MEGVSGRGGAGGGPAGMNADDIFADLFGGGMHFGFDMGGGMGGGRFKRRTKGEDSVIPYEVTLEDLYNGKTVRMMMEKEVECGACKGTGAKGSAKPKKCAKCDGQGWTAVHSQIGRGQLGVSRQTCSDCGGHGETLREKDRCKKCKGEKVVKEKLRQEIFIEKGMSDGQRIVLAGAGDQQASGDVIFVLKAKPNDSFERSGNDLLTSVKITLSEALLGFDRILVNHLDGRGIHLSSPPGKVIKSGQTLVLRGEGMPTYKTPDQKGNLYVVLEIEMPDEQWMQNIDRKTLESLLPPKKSDVEPRPDIVDEARFEESDMVEFGEGEEEAWEDEEEDMEQPECRQQ
ncbi:hypothetical protein EWM64_g1132 [Hericium alpestre]|uniref:CR-type domain-containing protein n=1 Tax=Hericium alpestre TaxID=135208 RepID=A0A4Z0ABA9_9AGAM|nr:hypothetical protein EWM64_g1132 [Hericium alpestre]